MLFTLGQFQYAEHGVAGHQRQQAQGLDLVAPGVKQHSLVGGQFVALAQIEQQHLFVFENLFGQGSGFVNFALLMGRIRFIQIVRGMNGQFALAMTPQHDADGVYFEVVMDLFGDFAHQLIHVQPGEHRVGNGDQNAEVITLAAQQIVVDIIRDPAVDLLRHHADNLRKGMQALVLRLAPRLIGVTDKLTAAKDTPIHRQWQQTVMTEGRIQRAFGKPWPGLAKLVEIAVQGVRARQNTTHRAVRQHRFIFIFDRLAVIARSIVAGAMTGAVPEHNRGAVCEGRLPDQPCEGIAQ
ncbi:hypothetical protein D3C72_1046020 [compost metagenome]